MLSEIQVVHVEQGWDMRLVHALREGLRARNLKPGQCLVAFNTRLDMARIIDAEGGVHTYYAYQGEEYDLETLAAQMRSGWKVELVVGQHERRRGRLPRAA